MNQQILTVESLAAEKERQANRKFVICPHCQHKVEVEDGKIPPHWSCVRTRTNCPTVGLPVE